MYRLESSSGEIIDPSDGQIVATMHCSATPEQGHLLAAAPEMLDALVDLIEAATRSYADIGVALRNARKAVKAAKGGAAAEKKGASL